MLFALIEWGTLGVLVLLGIVVFAVFNWRSFRKTVGAGRAQLGKIGEAAENYDPVAALQQTIEDGLENASRAAEAYAESGALVKGLERQVNDNKTEKARLENRIRLAVQAGDPNQTARENALALAEVERQLATNQTQYDTQSTRHASFAEAVKAGQKSINAARQRAKVLGVELKTSQREAEFGEYLKKFNYDPTAINSKFAEQEERIRQKIDANRAKVDAAVELSSQGLANLKDDELSRQADADAILERFRQPTQS